VIFNEVSTIKETSTLMQSGCICRSRYSATSCSNKYELHAIMQRSMSAIERWFLR